MKTIGVFRTYEVFNAMKLHWNSPHYDYKKYKGKIKSFTRFTLQSDRFKSYYERLNTHFKRLTELEMYLIPCFLENPKLHISSLMSEENDVIAREWYHKICKLREIFRKDSEKIIDYLNKSNISFEEFFLSDLIIDYMIDEEISLESFVILNKMIFFLNKSSTSSIIYNELYELKVKKYGTFLNVTLDTYKKIFENVIKERREYA